MIQKFTVEELIPTPHDCLITKVTLEHEYLIFAFENRLFSHESIRAIHPTADSLVMRFHLTNYHGTDNYRLYERNTGKFRQGYKLLKKEELLHLASRYNKLQYLYHYVGSGEMIIHFCTNKNYVLYICTDKVEFNWIESQGFV